MTRLVKIIDNKYVQIEEYRNPNICFNTNEYSDFEDYCTLRETFDPFEMFYENQELKKQLEEYQLQNINLREDVMIQKIAFPDKLIKDKTFYNLYDMLTYEELLAQQKEFIKYLEDGIEKATTNPYTKLSEYGMNRIHIYNEILQKYKEIIGDVKNEN